MPIIIVRAHGEFIPAIICGETEQEILVKLASLAATPDLTDIGMVQDWVWKLEYPSGWFDNVTEVAAYLDRVDGTPPVTLLAGEPVGKIRTGFSAQRSQDLKARLKRLK